MECLEEAVADRLELLEKIRHAFACIYPEPPLKMSPAPIQKELLRMVGVCLSGHNKRAVNEVLKDFGYRRVKVAGFHFFKKCVV